MRNLSSRKEDIDYLKRVITNLQYHIDRSEMFERERKEAEIKVNEELKVRGISYDSIGGGCTRVTPYVNELIVTEASLAQMKYIEFKKVMKIKKDEHLKERFDSLTVTEYNMLSEYFFKKMKLEDIGKKHNGKTKQWASNKIDEIVRKMLEVEY